MNSRQRLECALLLGAVALTRFLFRSHYLYDLDSVNFALAMGRFDPGVHQPHPPGYFLYVCLGRLLNTIFHDPNAALVAISIAASCGAAAMIYALAHEWFGPEAARFAGLLFLLSPLAWFHGTVALTYIVEAFFSALIGFISWRIYCGSTRWIVPGAVVSGIAAGIRPSSLLFLGPLYLFALRKISLKWAFTGLGMLLVTMLAWFVPMMRASGGLSAYFSSLFLLWRLAPGRLAVFSSFWTMSFARFLTIAFICVLCFGPAVALFARVLWRPRQSREPQKRLFTSVWITPGLLFFTFVFLQLINSGYLLVVFPPVCVWLGLWASEWYTSVQWRIPFKVAAIGLAAAVNVGIFLRAPLYCSYSAVRQFETDLENVQRALPQVASPGQTLVVAFDSHFLGFRHAGYYLPDYTIAEYPEFLAAAQKRVFSMRDRDTRLVTRLATNGFTQFVLFPLPSGKRYQQYLDQVREKLPDKDLRTTLVSGCDFLTGPIADLSFLFPAAAGSSQPLYTAHHDTTPSVYRR